MGLHYRTNTFLCGGVPGGAVVAVAVAGVGGDVGVLAYRQNFTGKGTVRADYITKQTLCLFWWWWWWWCRFADVGGDIGVLYYRQSLTGKGSVRADYITDQTLCLFWWW